jgi:hypothetical protein
MSDIIKDAGFVEDALQSMRDNLQLRESPFKTMFAIFGPILAWQRSYILGAILFVMGELGYGAGKIGEWIDKFLGFGSGRTPELSDTKLKNAAGLGIDNMLSELGIKSSAMTEELLIKESLSINDIVAIAAHVSDGDSIEKEARTTRTQFLRRFLGKAKLGGRVGLVNGLYSILKMFAKGLIGVGIAGGVVGAVKSKKDDATTRRGPTPFKEDPDFAYPNMEIERAKSMPPGVKAETYLNSRRDVEYTLIHFLDSAYKVKIRGEAEYLTFSDMFRKMSGHPLHGSTEMEAILNMVKNMNLGNLYHIDTRRTFVAPSLEFIAKKLLPGIQIVGGGVKVQKELAKALRGL